MARIRTVKPEFFRHADLYDLEADSGLPIRIAFAGLWTACDREGRFDWKPRELKLDCLPYDDVDFSRVLDALMSRGFVVRYASKSGEIYGVVPSFRKHQVINNKESASTRPDPKDAKECSLKTDACGTREPRVDIATVTPLSQTLMEGEGKDSSVAKATGESIAGKSDSDLFGETSLKDTIFGACRLWLNNTTGMPDKKSRQMLGKWVSEFGDDRTLSVLRDCARLGAVDHIPWIEKTLRVGKIDPPADDGGPYDAKRGAAVLAQIDEEYRKWGVQ